MGLSNKQECVKCGEIKPLEEGFYRNPSSKSGWHTACKSCRILYANKRQKKEYKRVRHTHYMRKYGISLEHYNTLHTKQSGLCAICHKPETGRFKFLAVDHCHKTGEIRGLLCHLCNKALGGFNDDPILVKKALDYLT